MGIETESIFMIKASLKNHLRGNPNAVSSIGIQDQAISLTHRFASIGFILLEPNQKIRNLASPEAHHCPKGAQIVHGRIRQFHHQP